MNPLPSAAIRETSRKPHLDAIGLGVVREQTLEQRHGHSDMHIPFPGMSNNELRGNLFVPTDWTPFSVLHSCDTNWVISSQGQGETSSLTALEKFKNISLLHT